MKIGVTGANGFIGSHVVEALVASNHVVTGLVRPTSNLRWLSGSPARLVYGDLFDRSCLQAFCGNQDAVIHCAARTAAPSRAAMIETNVAGTENLVAAALGADVGRFILLSSLEAVGNPGTSSPVDESVPLRPITAYGESKARAEDVLTTSGIPYTILRPGPVYGPRDTDVYMYFKIIDRGVRPVLPGPNRLSLCSWRSLLDAVNGALSLQTSGVYFCADGSVYSWDGITRAIEKAVERTAVTVRLPYFSLSLATIATRLYSAITGSVSILNPEKIKMLQVENLTASIDAASRDLGLRPRSTEEELKVTARWYRAHGWLRQGPVTPQHPSRLRLQ